MKKLFVFVLVMLTTFGVFADTNSTWGHSTDSGVYHITSDIAILTEEGNKFPEEEIFVTFLNVDSDMHITFIVPDSIALSELGGITHIIFGDDINTPTDMFEIWYSNECDGGVIFSLEVDDSEFVYYDMLYASQKTFFAFNNENMSKILVFNVNCSRLHKYSSYMY